MSFASLDFIIFFIIVLIGTTICQHFINKAKEILLLIASYFFYGYWDWRFCFLLFFLTTVSYFTAKYSYKKWVFAAGIIMPLIVLGFFKYFGFFLTSLSAIIGQDIGILNIILPVGISFYTFQALSYVIDVHRKEIPVEDDFIKLALYLSFFPQLVAGPIVKAADFLPQLKEERKTSVENILYGVQLIIFGLFKKIVIADHLSVFVDDVFYAPMAYSWLTIVLAVISYSIQIYFDFSGYSDIAIGCAKCLGYDLLPNFNLPYISENITLFWRRWHISLSTWLKQYLYIPLGGNRKGTTRRYINLLLTMLLGGLWHGANWTFVFWGFLHGVALCIDKIRPHTTKKNTGLRIVGVISTFLFVSLAWVFFRAENFTIAWEIIKGIFTFQQGILQLFSWFFIAVLILALSTLLAIIRAHKNQTAEINGFYPIVNLNSISGLTIFFVVCGLVVALAFTGERPFVYFQF